MKSNLVYSMHGFEYNDSMRIYRETVEQIRLAESLGFDAALICEHHLAETGFFPAPPIVGVGLNVWKTCQRFAE